jgi:hypothetical protein
VYGRNGRVYVPDITSAEIERRFAEAKRAARRAMVSDEAATRGWGSFPMADAHMPRGWK